MRRPYLLIVAALLCAVVATPGWSEDEKSSAGREDRLKAGYLFNFAKFVEWPASAASDSLTFCFVGAEGIQRSLVSSLGDKRIGVRRLIVRSIQEHETANGCELLFVDGKLPAAVLAEFGGSSLAVLTISDAKEFTHSGGIIALYTEDNRLRFVVNIENAARARLRISSNLLQLASAVEKGDSR